MDENVKEHNDDVDSKFEQHVQQYGVGPAETTPKLSVRHVISLVQAATGNAYYSPRSALHTHQHHA
jgi:hypothetical protein